MSKYLIAFMSVFGWCFGFICGVLYMGGTI